MPTLKLHTENLHKSFTQGKNSVIALHGIDLELAPGEFVALIGPSGCGKTTLLHILAGLITPDAGRLWLDGTRVQHARGHVAYMQQKDLLLPWRTVLDNSILGLEIQGVPKREAYERAHLLLERFGLAGFERAYPNQLSGGMRQRAALVRTLLLERPIWLLDEPFGALDAMTRSRLHRYLQSAWEGSQATVLFVTHDIEEALVLADRVAVMTARPGKIKAVLDVLMPRPRHVTSREFVALKAELLELLGEERLEEAVYETA